MGELTKPGYNIFKMAAATSWSPVLSDCARQPAAASDCDETFKTIFGNVRSRGGPDKWSK